MKRLYFALLFVLMGASVYAQQNVRFNVHHMLGANTFQMGTTTSNNNGVELNFSRCQYFISEITLIHDGGQQTMVPNFWIFADAESVLSEALGSFPITNLEAVKFGIGVQASYNHLDPSTYPSNHPLALKSPSMHWGWASGYIFAALEGNSGPSFSNGWEVHGLEDANYYKITVNTAGTMVGQDLVIDVYADYANALRNIDVSTGPIIHSGSSIARTMLQNFRDYVFSATIATGLAPSQAASFVMAPNPSAGPVQLQGNVGSPVTYLVYDYTGRVLKTIEATDGLAILDMEVPGCYLVAMQKEGQTVATKRLVVAR